MLQNLRKKYRRFNSTKRLTKSVEKPIPRFIPGLLKKIKSILEFLSS